jgi:hypothetical protein
MARTWAFAGTAPLLVFCAACSSPGASHVRPACMKTYRDFLVAPSEDSLATLLIECCDEKWIIDDLVELSQEMVAPSSSAGTIVEVQSVGLTKAEVICACLESATGQSLAVGKTKVIMSRIKGGELYRWHIGELDPAKLKRARELLDSWLDGYYACADRLKRSAR